MESKIDKLLFTIMCVYVGHLMSSNIVCCLYYASNECDLPHLEMEVAVVECCCGKAVVQTGGQLFQHNVPNTLVFGKILLARQYNFGSA